MKRQDRIITYKQDGGKAVTKLVKPPIIKGNKVVVETPGGQRSFGLRSVLAWVFGGKTHMPGR